MIKPTSIFVVVLFYFSAACAAHDMATGQYNGAMIQFACGMFWCWVGTKDDSKKENA